ncbi:MAG: acetyltransferase [Lachnospiraceae bacterium]|nr:acetyltransferase [Lachnospiraceae bacterium]
MGKKLLLIGGGGHCHSVLDTIMTIGKYNEIGIVDDFDSCSYLGVPVIGNDDDICTLKKEGWTDAFITVGSVGNTRIRRRLYEMIKKYDLVVPTIIDSTATIGKGVKIEEGVFIGKRTVINAGSSIGACAIINSGAIIEHDCEIGAFSHISPGTILCGQVRVGEDSHIGAGSVIRQLIEIGNNTLIGAGSVVVRNISDNVKAYGNPCKVVD